MAFNPENERTLRGAIGFLLLAVGCGATTLELGAQSPGDPGQPTAPLPRSRVLEPDFDPASLTAPAPAATTTPPATATPSSTVVYQCPMHAEVKREAPGRCPICGMKLEPHSPGHEGEHSSP